MWHLKHYAYPVSFGGLYDFQIALLTKKQS